MLSYTYQKKKGVNKMSIFGVNANYDLQLLIFEDNEERKRAIVIQQEAIQENLSKTKKGEIIS
jgi:hypothetical protein